MMYIEEEIKSNRVSVVIVIVITYNTLSFFFKPASVDRSALLLRIRMTIQWPSCLLSAKSVLQIIVANETIALRCLVVFFTHFIKV
jgi:hypothetical protein